MASTEMQRDRKPRVRSATAREQGHSQDAYLGHRDLTLYELMLKVSCDGWGPSFRLAMLLVAASLKWIVVACILALATNTPQLLGVLRSTL
jgi:hypothetical protein